eukprot:scaffold6995_cov19-Tisochrysis_lutea.AAC.1
MLTLDHEPRWTAAAAAARADTSPFPTCMPAAITTRPGTSCAASSVGCACCTRRCPLKHAHARPPSLQSRYAANVGACGCGCECGL